MSGTELVPEMPPRSKARKYSAGWKISQRGSGTRIGSAPFAICSGVGGVAGLIDRGVAGAVVAFAEQSLLAADRAVGVADGGPEDGGRRHRAARHGVDLALMAAAARFLRDAQIAGIDELDELRRLVAAAPCSCAADWPTSSRSRDAAA